MSESYRVAILLTMVGGYLNAYTYLSRGHVFATAETGNIVLMGINLAEGDYKAALLYAVPICSFSIGIFIATGIRQYRHAVVIHWRQIVLMMEVALLIVVSFIPQGELNIAANVMVAFVSALQFEAFKKMKNDAFATMFCTGNLRSTIEALFYFQKTKDKDHLFRHIRYAGIILAFITGVMLSSRVTRMYGVKAVLLPCIVLLAVVVILLPSK